MLGGLMDGSEEGFDEAGIEETENASAATKVFSGKAVFLEVSKYKAMQEKIVVPVDRLMRDKEIEYSKEDDKNLMTVLPLSEIRSGLIADADLFTKYGRQVLAKNTKIDDDHVKEIKRLTAEGLLAGEFKVQVPRKMK